VSFALHAPIPATARLAPVAIAIALALDALFPHAELVAVTIVVALAGADTAVLLTNTAVAAIPVALAFDALSVVTDLVRWTIVVISASPGQRAVGQRRQSHQTEHAPGRGLEHAATTGLLAQDAGHVIEPTIVHAFLPFAEPWPGSGSGITRIGPNAGALAIRAYVLTF
jgi:hypothetical protein